MKLKLFFIFFLLFSINKEIYAQVKLDPNNPNAKHDEILRLTDLSGDVNLPTPILIELKNYSVKNNILEKLVRRYDYIFKIILNEKLTKDERLFCCDYFLEASKYSKQGYPSTLILTLRQTIISN